MNILRNVNKSYFYNKTSLSCLQKKQSKEYRRNATRREIRKSNTIYFIGPLSSVYTVAYSWEIDYSRKHAMARWCNDKIEIIKKLWTCLHVHFLSLSFYATESKINFLLRMQREREREKRIRLNNIWKKRFCAWTLNFMLMTLRFLVMFQLDDS